MRRLLCVVPAGAGMCCFLQRGWVLRLFDRWPVPAFNPLRPKSFHLPDQVLAECVFTRVPSEGLRLHLADGLLRRFHLHQRDLSIAIAERFLRAFASLEISSSLFPNRLWEKKRAGAQAGTSTASRSRIESATFGILGTAEVFFCQNRVKVLVPPFSGRAMHLRKNVSVAYRNSSGGRCLKEAIAVSALTI